ncbi:hypothetical protein [Leminorella grimontii]|uniref:hypothetical protein n=1 Tax=Leminorella grimontii TaxID=82981 RepID=UPI00321FCD54
MVLPIALVALFVEDLPDLALSPATVYRPPSGYPIYTNNSCSLSPPMGRCFYAN